MSKLSDSIGIAGYAIMWQQTRLAAALLQSSAEPLNIAVGECYVTLTESDPGYDVVRAAVMAHLQVRFDDIEAKLRDAGVEIDGPPVVEDEETGVAAAA